MLTLNPVARSSWERVLDLCNNLQNATNGKCANHSENDGCTEIRDIANVLFSQVMTAIQEESPASSGGPGVQNRKAALVEHMKDGSMVKRTRSTETESQRKKKITRGKRVISCMWCKTTESPEWRSGPHFATKLCNACGLQLRKMNQKEKEDKKKSSIESLLN